MCNLSQWIREEGYAEGYAKGIKKEMEKGIIKTTLYYVNSLTNRKGFSITEAMDMLDVNEKIRPIIQ